MIGSTIILSAAIILYFSDIVSVPGMDRAGGGLELAAMTLMPYMISAVVAALTAIGVMAILPLIRARGVASVLEARLREMAAGDLVSRVYGLDSTPHLRSIANELNATVEALGNQVASWKVINRRQWEVLQLVRSAAAAGNTDRVIIHVGEMEANWRKIAELEEKLAT